MSELTKLTTARRVDRRRWVCVLADDGGVFWVGMLVDGEFHARDQYGTGAAGEHAAVVAARIWADGIVRDKEWTR
jgi:hypothetical protein